MVVGELDAVFAPIRLLPALALLLLSAPAPVAETKTQPAAAPEPAAATVAAFGRYAGAAPGRYDAWQRTSRYVAASDGTRLAMDLFLPTRGGVAASERLPVLWTMTPYRRAVADGGAIFTVVDLYEWLPELLRQGYSVACVDARGTGASFGSFQGMFHARETQDGYDVTEWVAAQPWSNGRVGMFGQSYLGITQYMAASRRPPHLRAIFPEMAAADMYELVYKGGIDHLPLLASWSERLRQRDADEAAAVPVDEDADRSLLRAALAEHRASRSAAEVYAAAPFRDSVDPVSKAVPFRDWTPIGHLRAIRDSGIPVHHLTGWYDRYVRDQIVMFRNLRSPQRLTIGPWGHSEMGQLDHAAEHLRWWDHWLKDVDTGLLREPPVHYFMMGAEPGTGWRAAPAWPLPEERREVLRLVAGRSGSVPSINDGKLAAIALASEGRDELVVDPAVTVEPNPRFTTAPAAPELSAHDARGLTYTTEPLAQPLEIVGHPVARLWVSSSGNDADVFVYLEDVDAAGASRYVSEGALRASRRRLADPGYDFMGLPHHSGLAADRDPLRPGEPVELRIDLYPTAYRFAAGHRLRLTITGADAANTRVDPATLPRSIAVWRGRAHDSQLELPVLGDLRASLPIAPGDRAGPTAHP